MKELRMNRLFGRDGRSVIIACDHAGFMGPLPGLDDPGYLLGQISGSGIDAVLTTMGVARRFASCFGKLGLILRADGGSTIRNSQTGQINCLFSAQDAVRLGADAVVCMGMIGYPEERSSLLNLAALSAEAAQWNLPVMAEMLVNGKDGHEPTAEDIGFAVRIGAELGADLIKASYAGPPEKYGAAIRACYRPVVVLGGSKVNEEEVLFESIQVALEAGARGVAIGRNVWQHTDPAGMCRALVSLVHGGASVTSALKEIKR
jgi:class I fructose-bisphosphate aldolase